VIAARTSLACDHVSREIDPQIRRCYCGTIRWTKEQQHSREVVMGLTYALTKTRCAAALASIERLVGGQNRTLAGAPKKPLSITVNVSAQVLHDPQPPTVSRIGKSGAGIIECRNRTVPLWRAIFGDISLRGVPSVFDARIGAVIRRNMRRQRGLSRRFPRPRIRPYFAPART